MEASPKTIALSERLGEMLEEHTVSAFFGALSAAIEMTMIGEDGTVNGRLDNLIAADKALDGLSKIFRPEW